VSRYCAYYQHRQTGSARLEIRRAANYWQAIAELPVNIYIDGRRFRRQGVPREYDSTGETDT